MFKVRIKETKYFGSASYVTTVYGVDTKKKEFLIYSDGWKTVKMSKCTPVKEA